MTSAFRTAATCAGLIAAGAAFWPPMPAGADEPEGSGPPVTRELFHHSPDKPTTHHFTQSRIPVPYLPAYAEVCVDPNSRGAFDRIAKAIKAVAPGGTVLLAPSASDSGVVINKPINLRAVNSCGRRNLLPGARQTDSASIARPTLWARAGDSDFCLRIDPGAGEEVRVTGLDFKKHPDPYGQISTGCVEVLSGHAVLEGNQIDAPVGIDIQGGTAEVRNNLIRVVRGPDDWYAYGIYVRTNGHGGALYSDYGGVSAGGVEIAGNDISHSDRLTPEEMRRWQRYRRHFGNSDPISCPWPPYNFTGVPPDCPGPPKPEADIGIVVMLDLDAFTPGTNSLPIRVSDNFIVDMFTGVLVRVQHGNVTDDVRYPTMGPQFVDVVENHISRIDYGIVLHGPARVARNVIDGVRIAAVYRESGFLELAQNRLSSSYNVGYRFDAQPEWIYGGSHGIVILGGEEYEVYGNSVVGFNRALDLECIGTPLAAAQQGQTRRPYGAAVEGCRDPAMIVFHNNLIACNGAIGATPDYFRDGGVAWSEDKFESGASRIPLRARGYRAWRDSNPDDLNAFRYNGNGGEALRGRGSRSLADQCTALAGEEPWEALWELGLVGAGNRP